MKLRLLTSLLLVGCSVHLAGPDLSPAAASEAPRSAAVVNLNRLLHAAAEPGRQSQRVPAVPPDHVFGDPELEPVSAVFHDHAHGRVVLLTEHPPDDAFRRLIGTRFGPQVVLAHLPESLRPTSRDADTSPFSAGAAIGNHGADRLRCTSGFSWITDSGASALLTAGHCYPAGRETSAATNAVPSFGYWVGRAVDTTATNSGTIGLDGDLALIDTTTAADGAPLNREGQAQLFTGGPASTTTVPVNGVNKLAALGSQVCYSSAILGEECGPTDETGHGGYTVIDTAFSYRSSDGRIWTNLALAYKDWGYCVRGGESGSPVYLPGTGDGVIANGILNGGSGGDIEDRYVSQSNVLGNCLMTFTQLGNAYNRWGGHVEVSK